MSVIADRPDCLERAGPPNELRVQRGKDASMSRIDVVRLVADPYPPYQYQAKDRIEGVDHDVICAAFAEHGITVHTTLLPWEQCIESVRDGAAHGVFQIQRTPERQSAFIFSKPLRTARTIFLARNDSTFRFSSEEIPEATLSKHLLGVVRGYGYDDMIANLPESAKLAVDSQEELLRGVSEGRFDVAVVDSGVGGYLSAKLHIFNLRPVEGNEISRVLHVAFAKDAGEIARTFDLGLERVRSKGIDAEIRQRYAVSD